MTSIEEQIKPWSAEGCETGMVVRDLVLPQLHQAVKAAYASVGAISVPDDLLQQEERKFCRSSTGDFSPEYFSEQALIARNIAAY